jgi:hypothetical protein
MEQVNIRLLEPSTKRQQTSNGSDVFKFVMNCVYYGDQVRPDFVTLQSASLDLLVGDAEGLEIDSVNHAALCLFVICSRTDPPPKPNARPSRCACRHQKTSLSQYERP